MVENLPNLLTITRILLLPFFAVNLIYGEYHYALLVFAAAAISDILDGQIARITKQTTYFGSILDPVADKFFLITSFILMSYIGLIPKWFTIVVISKDLIVIAGCFILYFATDTLKVEPSIIGKISSGSQFVLVGLMLVSLNMVDGFIVPQMLYIAIAILTAIAGIDYVYKGMKQGTEHTPS
ncbi:putative CDP-diacylglycerol--glycerol-3-phosphate 3-phosphatidyl-transferase 2 [bacterium BMS3Abin09]|nr:putative CDP-diacylglycerol--glycerol-3-phosphate 3-phosphatidyl-transferase 2 [bacterium BMS3Abin09]GBE41278.1 putative CDP-diacylglycerol--glycerol-3-phosphate 3-phosphatidyl-transferase 2 [bacterium BMS3Bbin09]HDH34495.1 CDP-alcohol phosphatidyltransferase family protein [Nitrospirota bacterium]HDN94736.1 CDP-alcohol phosphatidyltransferase family protein [Nitrospirota bacterium]